MATVVVEDFQDTSYNVTWSGDWTIYTSGSAKYLRSQASLESVEHSSAFVYVPSGSRGFQVRYQTDIDPDFDEFQIIVDGVVVHTDTGNSNLLWSPIIDVYEKTVIRLAYFKNGDTTDYADFVYVDELIFTLSDADEGGSYVDSFSLLSGAGSPGPENGSTSNVVSSASGFGRTNRRDLTVLVGPSRLGYTVGPNQLVRGA